MCEAEGAISSNKVHVFNELHTPVCEGWVLMKNAVDRKNNYFYLPFYYAVVNQMLAGDGMGGMF